MFSFYPFPGLATDSCALPSVMPDTEYTARCDAWIIKSKGVLKKTPLLCGRLGTKLEPIIRRLKTNKPTKRQSKSIRFRH